MNEKYLDYIKKSYKSIIKNSNLNAKIAKDTG